VRADALDRLTQAGWAALWEHGVRTVVDLRNDDELRTDLAPRPTGIDTVHVALDGVYDTEFWDHWASGPQFGTPLYYGPFLERLPERAARAVAAIARARPGGVAFHCGVGRDRAGLVSILALALVGVAPEDIADDYALSAANLIAYFAAAGEVDQGPELDAYLAGQGTSARDVVVELLATLDVAVHLAATGLAGDDLAALRARLLEPSR
jgi:hypothetical protein